MGFGLFRLAWFVVLLGVYLLLTFKNKLPTIESVKSFADVINSAGGHILVLSGFSAWFFSVAVGYIYHVLSLPDEITTKHDAIIMTAVGFVTGTAFGGAWSALLKTMSGGAANGIPKTASVPVAVTPVQPEVIVPPPVPPAQPPAEAPKS